jgi:hypothetical protein
LFRTCIKYDSFIYGRALTSWRTIAIARDRRRVWPGWLGWNAPTLTHRVRTRPVNLPARWVELEDKTPSEVVVRLVEKHLGREETGK